MNIKQYKFNMQYSGRFFYSWGYALYSAFLESLDTNSASLLHQNSVFNQHIRPKDWVINSNTDISLKDVYNLNKYGVEIKLNTISCTQVNEQAMADMFLVKSNYKKNIVINFLTPTSFKSNNEYVLFPSESLIMNNLTNKWNNFANNFVLEDMLWDNCRISQYNLKSVYYQIKAVKIPAFVGSVELFFGGGESLIRLANLIWNFANYSGVGIKTSLGMGGVKVE